MDLIEPPKRVALRLLLIVFAFLFFCIGFGYAQEKSIRFIDSETGYAIQPEVVVDSGRSEKIASADLANGSGQGKMALSRGLHRVTISSANHKPFSQTLVEDGSANPIRIFLDPIIPPLELNPDRIISLHRADATIILGFIVDDDSGEPLENVLVSSEPSGRKTQSNARGFFELAIPLQSEAEKVSLPAKLIFEKSGYKTNERQNLELWPNGDWTYRIRLSRGMGRFEVSERATRQYSANVTSPEILPQTSSAEADIATEQITPLANDEPVTEADTAPSNATIRVPRTIRVLQSDGVTIDYLPLETYLKHVLPYEWPASWGSFSGSLETFKAGSVAGRSYAVARVNNASSSATYDICATTSCQVYNPAGTYTATDNAINQTAGYVVVSGSSIASSEYSAENNSSGFSCGDGYTQPTGGCIFDPVCSGQVRSGHGRGMCQWGTLRWGTGLKFNGNWNGYPGNGNSGVTNGYAKTNWLWMISHYYPTLRLVQGKQLVVGDDVKATASIQVRMNADGSISNATTSGINCPLIATKASSTVGVIITNTPNPVWVTNDGRGYTWYKIQWSDSTVGWSPENWLQRIIPTPAAPSGLTISSVSSTQINLSWTDNSVNELEFIIQQALAAGGPWIDLDTVSSNITTYSSTGLSPSTAYYYRIRSYNLGGNSAASDVASTNTLGIAPTLAAIPNKTVTEGNLLTFTNSATASENVQSLTDFEEFSNGASALFRAPNYSGSTASFLDASPNVAQVTDTFPAGANLGSLVMKASWSWNATANPWLRLTTSSAVALPSPVIDFTKTFRFNIYTDKNLQVAIGCRETTNAVGTPIGSNGGAGTAIEWAGVAGKNGNAPIPTRTVTANTWTTLMFNLPTEPITSFSAGNGVLSTASGLGVLEHVTFVPSGGIGTYNVYLDNFEVVTAKTLTYSLDPGAPTNASINAITGVFAWTPTEVQGPGVYNITVRVADNSAPPLSDVKTFSVTVNETNQAPVLTAIANKTIHAGTTLVLTNSATDLDFPINILTFSLDPGAPENATINSTSGIFSFATTDAQAGSANPITVRVTDNGSPTRSDAKNFTVNVVAPPSIQGVTMSEGTVTFTWNAISGKSYRIQYKTNLNDANWMDLPDVTAVGATASFSDMPGTSQRFYRIFVLN